LVLLNLPWNYYKLQQYEDKCKCRNFMYIPKELSNLIKVYYKNTYNPSTVPGSLTYDGEYLKIGFCEDILF